MRTECHFFKISHGCFGSFSRSPHSPCFCSSIIRELVKLYKHSLRADAKSHNAVRSRELPVEESDIFSTSAVGALGSSHVGRIRLDFVSGASSESWESFTTRIVTVKYYHSKASISRISIVQARQSSTIGHHPPRLPRRRRFIRSPRGGALIRFYGLLRRLTKMSQADWPKPLEFSGWAARTCRVGQLELSSHDRSCMNHAVS